MAAFACAALAGCGDGATEPPAQPDPPHPATVTVSPATAQLTALGVTVQLTAEVLDQNGQAMTGAAVSWMSSAQAVATVDAEGLVAAAGNGTATITATAGSASGTAAVTVAQEVSAVSVHPAADTLLARGDTLRLSAEATDANGHAVAGAQFAWASGDTAVATVDTSGLVTGIRAGEVAVTATSSEVSGLADLVVVAPAPTTVTVTPDAVALTAIGQTEQFAAEVRDQIGRVIDDIGVVWSSGDTTVAAVDTLGLVTAAGPGATTVAAAAGDAAGEAMVTVMQSVGTVVVSPASDTIALGDTVSLAAEAFDENGHAVESAEFTWSSIDVSVASVDATGLVTGVAEGTTTITASVGVASGASQITVENPDRAALVALYEATDGPNWKNNTNWLTDAPLGEWYGVRTNAVGRVIGLWFDGNNLTGPIPSELGNLIHLENLDLQSNSLSGSISPELANLASLEYLNLGSNSLTGSIPVELGKLTKLRTLYLGYNDFSAGPIPPWLAAMPWPLEILVLYETNLTGAIPPGLANLASLTWLGLGNNDLTGPIPSELGNLIHLERLDLQHNSLTGNIPATLGRLDNLRILDLSRNDLTGWIPPELGNLAGLRHLHLSDNNLSGPIPPELGDLSSLEYLYVGSSFEERNALTGPIPPELGGLTSLKGLGLHRNRLSGSIPPELGRLAGLDHLYLNSNELSGPIPAELGDLGRLQLLFLSENQLSGMIPLELRNIRALELLLIDENAELCAPDDPPFLAWLIEKRAYAFKCLDPNVRKLPTALIREDGNGLSLALPEHLHSAAAVHVSDPEVVAASVAVGWLELAPVGRGSAQVEVVGAGGAAAVADVVVREPVGTFGIDVVVDQPAPIGYAEAMMEAADWWSYILDGNEWPDREAGCPTWDPFRGKARALADELLIGARTGVFSAVGYAEPCFFPKGEGSEGRVLDPGGGYVVARQYAVGSQGLLRHEIGHLLGLVLLAGREEDLMTATKHGEYFTGARAVEAFRAGGGDAGLPGVPLQKGGAHWHGELVGYELMGPFGGWDANAISLGALVDRGYTVDLSKALPWPWSERAMARTIAQELQELGADVQDVVLGEPRVFVERRPRDPPR